MVDTSLISARRPEPELAKHWGLYSPLRDAWLDVMFATEREAEESRKVLMRARAR